MNLENHQNKGENKQMKWLPVVALGMIAIFFLGAISIGLYSLGVYNNLVTLDEDVNSKWSQVENVYQRRNDLIPNLVESTKGYAIHESETLKGVVNARAKATSTNINIGEGGLNAANLAAFQAAQGELSSALSRLLAVVESYPDLKANTLFQDLMAEVAGTENRIAVGRKDFNDSAQKYNTTRNKFPAKLVADYFDFEERPYFEAQEGSDVAPRVNFDSLRSNQ